MWLKVRMALILLIFQVSPDKNERVNQRFSSINSRERNTQDANPNILNLLYKSRRKYASKEAEKLNRDGSDTTSSSTKKNY